MAKANNRFTRSAGILLPVSSLPSKYGIGTLGQAAYDFVDFLRASGQHYWQVLPVGPTSYGDSPYQSFSAFAGNPYFIDLETLCGEGLLDRAYLDSIEWGGSENRVDYARMYEVRFEVLRKAFAASNHLKETAYIEFCRENEDWLPDYSLFMALKNHFGGVEWQKWEEDIRVRKPSALKKYRELLEEDIFFWSFLQYKFFCQWKALRDYAHENDVFIIGDIPIYIAMDSADAWANTDQFWMDEERRPVKVAGVPPDYFSKTGQLWGNPLYRWDVMEADNFGWWRRRISFSSQIYDVIRIDHFIGIVRYYTIDAGAENAINGEWLQGPGMKLLNAIDEARGSTRIIAEDLGEVVPEVRKVQIRSGYPGMKVIQFAFDSDASNIFLPHNHGENFIVYTGTHDNDTTAGLIASSKPARLRFARGYLGVSRSKQLPEAFIRAAFSSVAHTAIVPIQDWLGLGSEARINTPSTLGGNWEWRMPAGALTAELADKIKQFTEMFGR